MEVSMRSMLTACLGLGLTVGAYFAFRGGEATGATKSEGLLAHCVYFSLKDNSAPARQKLVAACKKYLSKHPGEVFFAAGTLAEDLKREVNDRDFDVSLLIVFASKAAQDQYQEAARHKQFIAENRDNWKKVRVFDSVVQR
jgi:hypothetical protein